jgi:hypothetical protein
MMFMVCSVGYVNLSFNARNRLPIVRINARSEGPLMADFAVGEMVGIECTVQPGPFSEERLISFDTVHGPISGFVQESDLRQVGDKWRVRAVILAIRGDILEVRVRGSFFTTNGLAAIPQRYASAA